MKLYKNFQELFWWVAIFPFLGGCPGQEGELCTTRIQIRLSDPSPLRQDSRKADVSRVIIEREEQEVFNGVVDLHNASDESIQVEIIDVATGKPPQISPSDSFRLTLAAYCSICPAAPFPEIFAIGSIPRFGCVDKTGVSVPLYLGPANQFAKGENLLSDRIGTTSTLLSNGQVLIVGGQTFSGQASEPVVLLYNHDNGKFCGPNDGCFSGSLPSPRVEHTSTLLSDGSVLIFGGRTPGSDVILGEAIRFDAQKETFTPLSVTFVPRSRHAVAMLSGYYVPTDRQSQLLIAGGFGGNGAHQVLSDWILLDVQKSQIVASGEMLNARADHSATLLSSGQVLLAGGSDDLGEPLDSAELFDSSNLSSGYPQGFCPGGGSTSLCTKRTLHTATLLDDDNVLLWGGQIKAVPDGATDLPTGEVFVLGLERFLPALADAHVLETGTKHSATKITCRQSPCPILVIGGKGTSLLAPFIYYPATTQPDETSTYYEGSHSLLQKFSSATQRYGHTATTLKDGTVLLVGGQDDTHAFMETSLFSFCEALDDTTCPVP